MADFPRGTRVIPVCSTPLPANKLKRKSVGQFTEMRALATRPSIAIRELPIWPKGTNSKSGDSRGFTMHNILPRQKALTALVFGCFLRKAPSHSQWEVQSCAY